MSHELMKLKRILPTINGKRTELLFNDDYRLPEKPSTSKPGSRFTKRDTFEKEKAEKEKPEKSRQPDEDTSFHPVKETIKQLIEEKFTNIHDLLTNTYEEHKLHNINASPLNPSAKRPQSKAITITLDRVSPAKPAIIHSRPMTQETGKLYGSLGRNFSQQAGLSNFGVTSSTRFNTQKEVLFSLDGKKAIKLDAGLEDRPITNFSTSARSKKFLTFSEKFGPKRKPKQVPVPEISTRYDRFMLDNPQRKSYSRRLKDPDSFYVREIQRRREIAILDDRNNIGPTEGNGDLNTSEGLMVNSKKVEEPELEPHNHNKDDNRTARFQEQIIPDEDLHQEPEFEKPDYPEFEKPDYPELDCVNGLNEQVDNQIFEQAYLSKNDLVNPSIILNGDNSDQIKSVQIGEPEFTSQTDKLSIGELGKKPTSLYSILEDGFYAEKAKQQVHSLNSLVMRGNEVGSMVSTNITLDKPSLEELPHNKLVKEEAAILSPKLEAQSVRNEPSTNRETACRICLDNEQNAEVGTLIKPCQCAGSMQWVHDECLKTWIAAKAGNIDCASCELCNTIFNMEFTFRTAFRPQKAFNERLLSLVSCLCLSFISLGLLTVVAVIAINWNSSNSVIDDDSPTQNSSRYKLSAIVVCFIISSLMFICVFLLVRDICFRIEIKEWKFLPPILDVESDYVSDSPTNENNNEESAHDPICDQGSEIGKMPDQELSYVQEEGNKKSQQSGGRSTHLGVIGLDRNQLMVQSGSASFESMNSSLNISQFKDLNVSGMSEGAPLRIASKLKSHPLPATKNQNLPLKDKQTNSQEFVRAQTMGKNTCKSSISSDVQRLSFPVSNSLVLDLESQNQADNLSKKISCNEYSSTSVYQEGDHNQADPLSLAKSDRYSHFPKNNTPPNAQTFRPTTAQNQTNCSVPLYKQIPKAFLDCGRQQDKKVIEVMVNAASKKSFDNQISKGENESPNPSSPIRKRKCTMSTPNQFSVENGKSNSLQNSQNKGIIIATHKIQ